ncbi:MAG: hypothetical protein LBJ10_05175, partial [Clostridiales bacterium]|nr:hypothetical protein [Clostridiales bacterium]
MGFIAATGARAALGNAPRLAPKPISDPAYGLPHGQTAGHADGRESELPHWQPTRQTAWQAPVPALDPAITPTTVPAIDPAHAPALDPALEPILDPAPDPSMFEPLGASEKSGDGAAMEGESFLRGAWRRFRGNRLAMLGALCLGAVVLSALLGPLFSQHAFDGQNSAARNAPVSAAHWFGADKFGRDIFVRVMAGARISLLIGFATAAINLALGIIYGGISGYLGGKADMLMMR